MQETKYRVLDGHDPFPLAARTAGRVKALRLLQIASAYYSERDRYGLIKEMCVGQDWILKEDENSERGTVTFDLKPPAMGSDEFRDKVAALLFPDAPVEENADAINYEAVEDALDAFLGFIEPRHRKQAAPLPWQTIFQNAAISNTPSSPEVTA